MKDNKGVTLVEVVVAISITSIILISIYSFYISGVKSYARETTKASNQVSVRRVSNAIGKEIRKASSVLITDPGVANTNTLVLTDSDNKKTIIRFDSSKNTIKADYYLPANNGDSSLSSTSNLATRIGNFTLKEEDDKIIVTVESIENSEGYKEKLETVISKRK